MVASSTADKVAEAVRPAVENAGLVLEEVKVAPAGARTVVRVIVDLGEDESGALSLDRVAEVSREISDLLDVHPALPGAFTLEVSSPGTSRPLTELRHFKRARTRMVTVTLHDGTSFTRRLTAVEGDELVFDDGEHTVAFADVDRGLVEVELKRANAIDESEFVDFEGSDSSDQMDDEV